ncbi:hypothetical protein V1524DRAFT_374735 [Lipomyces starkeyi]
MSDSDDNETLKLQFIELTQASPEEAGAFLESVGWDLDVSTLKYTIDNCLGPDWRNFGSFVRVL